MEPWYSIKEMVHLRHSTSTVSTGKCFLPAGTDPPHRPLMKVCEAAQRPKQVKPESHSVKAYADNATLLSTSKETHQTLLLELDDKCSEIGLQIHPNKCVSFVFNGQKICRKYAVAPPLRSNRFPPRTSLLLQLSCQKRGT